MAFVSRIRHFRFMLEGKKFMLFTDHKQLTFALTNAAEPWTACHVPPVLLGGRGYEGHQAHCMVAWQKLWQTRTLVATRRPPAGTKQLMVAIQPTHAGAPAAILTHSCSPHGPPTNNCQYNRQVYSQ